MGDGKKVSCVFGHIYINNLKNVNCCCSSSSSSHDDVLLPSWWSDIQRYIRNFLQIRIRSLRRHLATMKNQRRCNIKWNEHEEMKSLLDMACRKIHLQQRLVQINFIIPPIDINNNTDDANSFQSENNDFNVAADDGTHGSIRITDEPTTMVDVLPCQNRIVVDLTVPARLSILDQWSSSCSGTVDTFIHPYDDSEFSLFLSSSSEDDIDRTNICDDDDNDNIGNNLPTCKLSWWDRPPWAWTYHEEMLARGAIIAGELVTNLHQYLMKISSDDDNSLDPFMMSILNRTNLFELTVTDSPSIPTNMQIGRAHV